MSQVEGKALMSTLDEAAPTHPTACAGWTARDIVAHLAAGPQEIADLIEEKLAGSDAVCDELLAQPELTDHAVGVLNAMPILNESLSGAHATPAGPRSRSSCAQRAGRTSCCPARAGNSSARGPASVMRSCTPAPLTASWSCGEGDR